MAEKKVTRKLAAILATDMVGFSRLMEKDEAGTVARQKGHRNVLIDPKIAEHNGRIVKSTGDGLLVEFASAVDAVQCAVEVQRAMSELEADVPEDRRIAYRAGVNLGDIIVEDDDILGDGVNIAARLQMLAEPGGICVSRNVFNQVKNKVELGFVDLGPQKVKNIEEPVPTYKVLLDPAQAGTVVALKRTAPKRLRWAASAAAAVLLLVVAGLAWRQPWVPHVERAQLAKMAFPLPKEPSIAVLPFDNLTGDKTQDYLTYGIAGKITAKLARTSGIFVITRPAAFGYYRRQKAAVKAGKAAEDFGVRHVLMGSVQRSGERLRVTVQLIDAVSGRQMWADQYDGAAKNLFAFQDEIAQKVIAELEVKLTVGEQARIWRKQTTNPDAYDLFMRGVFHYQRRTRPENAKAQKIFQQVVRMDPGFAEAQCLLGFTHLLNVRFRWSKDPRADLARAEVLAQKAIAKDPDYPHAYALLGSVSLRKRRHDQALAQARKALELEPHYANNIGLLALIQMNAGQATEALGTIRRAMRLYPYYPHWYLWVVADSYRQLGKYDEAILAAKRWRKRWPRSWLPPALLAATYVQAGRIDEAKKTVRQLRERRPKITARIAARVLVGRYKNPQETAHIKEALLKAGLPEGAPPLPKKPSIAVLPFTNMSGDKEQDYFADGMTDDLITGLSKVSGLIVLSRTTVFTLKGKKVKIKDIARTLGVRYVLEGSVRRAGGMVRINAQLIDGTTGGHVWAETFDRDYTNIFALQDEVKGKIVRALKVKLTPKERLALKRQPTKNLEAYDLYLKAERGRRSRNFYKVGRQALLNYEKALAIDPEFVDAHVGKARHLFSAWINSWFVVIFPPEAKKRLDATIKRILILDPSNSDALGLQVLIQLYSQKHDEALRLARSAVVFHPDNASLRAVLARVLLAADRRPEAKAELKRAMRLTQSPTPELLYDLSGLHLGLGEPEAAIQLVLRARKGGIGTLVTASLLANAYARVGKTEAARAEIERLQKVWPWMSVSYFRLSLAHHRNRKRVERALRAWRRSGVPEWPFGFQGRKADRLGHAELKAMYHGRSVKEVGQSAFDGRFERVMRPDGSLTMKVALRPLKLNYVTNGRWEIVSDQICYRIDAYAMGRRYCTEIYLDSKRSTQKKKRYLRPNYYGVWKFTIETLENRRSGDKP